VFTARYELNIQTQVRFVLVLSAVRLVPGFSPRRPGFDPRSVHIRFVVDKVAVGQVFCEYFGLSLSVYFQLCSILIRTLLLLLSER